MPHEPRVVAPPFNEDLCQLGEQAGPFGVELPPGTYLWCSCGLSQKQPFCNGAHKGTSFRPVVQKVTDTETLWFCGCKATRSPPLCDGSHKAFV